ncbi:ABC transporter ATP-binding protein [Planomonospora parontospora]|uniref:ABC transporter ATP-binding protein n=1 Tax=Planomonospora parontospora TaxID=58119 RepID=UPI0016706A6A|nr:ATP-binding cassette domain-containing protein [Planomonospora parontospora]GGL36062.1 ABC transporter ATP-binding protein [Planomonospora parontospora subsp. antibiotica]GII17415.1 ABC transporter ATP-binding protein [Planomonospora parontospora subsp. antibiotica]
MIEIDDLHKRYGDKTALAGVSFSVKPGEMFGFVGANGAGKTTTMRILMGVLSADSGQVRWNGGPLAFADRRRFGYMPEERGLYQKMKVAEQVEYFGRLNGLAPAAARKATADLLERLSLTERAGDEVGALSLGNQQRVQLAVALVHEPEALVLDEPFSGLDPIAVDALAEVLVERRRAGAPVLFSSHQLDLVERLCDAVGIISAGRMVASGTVGELRAGEGRGVLKVVVREAAPGWTAGLPGDLTANGDEVLFTGVEDDGQEILRAAAAAGRVEHFGWERPSLTEIFREAVA